MSQKWVQLLTAILRSSGQGQIDWKETSNDDSFQTTLGGHVVEIEYVEFLNDFTVRVFDSHGKVADVFNNDDMRRLTGESWLNEIGELVQNIRRRISGAEQVLDDVLQALAKKDEEIPF